MNNDNAAARWSQRESTWASTFLAERGFTLQAQREHRPSSRFILDHVAILYGFEREPFIRDRHRDCAKARHIAMFVARELTLESLPQIAVAFGKSDHTTVMYACNRVRDRAAIEPSFAKEVADVRSLICESYTAYRENIEAQRRAA
jgi:chromosomal replication initiation ATPase DnaA